MKNIFKEAIQKETTLQLKQALGSLKTKLGEKKFEKRIKKAVKMLCAGIKPANPGIGTKANPVAAKTVSKTTTPVATAQKNLPPKAVAPKPAPANTKTVAKKVARPVKKIAKSNGSK